MSANILVLLPNNVEEIEFITPVDLWRRAGYSVTTASLTSSLETISQQGITILADSLLDQISLNSFDYLFLPGGKGHCFYLDSSLVQNTIQSFINHHKTIIAICAAPIVLTPWLQNKKATCYPSLHKKLPEFIDQKIVIDLPFITAQGAGVASDLAFFVIEQISGKDFRDQLKSDTIFV